MHFRYHSVKRPPAAVASKVNLVRLDFMLPHQHPELFEVPPYRVGPQDVLNITVWDHPELTIPAGEYRSAAESGIQVDENGHIFYPFAGQFSVNHLTADQIRRTLSDRLVKYIRDPQISVRVASYNSQKIQLLGAIKNQTQNITSVPLSLMEAINTAGGLDPNAADTSKIYVVRPGEIIPTIYVLNADDPSALVVSERFYLRNNDLVYVSTAGITNWSKFINQLLPSLGSALAVANTVD